MPDNQLSFTTRVDLSGLKSGMEEVKASVQSTASASAQSVEEFSSRARAATEAYNSAAAGTVAQQKALGEAFDAAKLSGATYVEALEQAVAATASLNSVEAAETQTLRGNMSARMAASAEMRVLEGSTMGSTRAAAAFLTTIPGIGTALQAAFPIFGAVALGEVIVDVGKKLYDAFDLGGERARKTQEDIRGVNDELNKSSTSLDVQIDKLQQEQAKLEKTPFNGTKLALDEAAEAAQNLSDRLDTVIQKELVALKGMSASVPQRVLQGGSQTGYEQTMLEEHDKWLGQSKNDQDSLNESVSFHASLVTRLNELQQKQATEQEAARDAAAAGNSARVTDYSNEINATQQLLNWQAAEQANIQKTIDLSKQQAATQGARDHHSTGNPDEKRLRAIETTFAQESAVHKKSAGEAAAFWSEYVNTFKVGTEQYLEVLDKYNAASEQNLNKGSLAKKQAEQNKQNAHSNVGADQDAAELDRAQRVIDAWRTKTSEDITETGERWKKYHEDVARGAVIDSQVASEIQLSSNAANVASGRMSKLAEDHATAAIHAQQYAEELKILKQQLDDIANDPALDKAQKATASQGVQNQITQVQGKQASSAITDNSKIESDVTAPFKSGFNTINTDFLKVQSQMILGTKSISAAFAKMGTDIVVQGAAWAEKWLAKQAISYTTDVLYHNVANQQKKVADMQYQAAHTVMQTQAATNDSMLGAQTVAAHAATTAALTSITAAGAASGTAISATASTAQNTQHASVAATGALASISAIPYVGPFIAPAVAAGIMVLAMNLSHFDVGGIIPGTGAVPIMGHGGERVLTPTQTATFEQFVGNMASSSSTNNSRSVGIHQTFNGGGSGGDHEFRRMMRRNATHVAKTVHSGLRQMGRA